ncbi:MAG TPA: type II secretion system protein, partial [Opitutales bacterium]|nr:type II secretion system protein [Opitutales bacterium]
SNPQAGPTGLDALRRQRGFTLVEIMMVVSLIAILAYVVGVSITGGSAGMALGNAQRNLLVMVEAAQSAAQRNHTRARLIIFSDKNWLPGSSPQSGTIDAKILRYYGVISAFSDDPTVKTEAGVLDGKTAPYHVWQAETEGTFLPEDVYFVPSEQSQFALDLPNFAQDTKNNAVTAAYTYPQTPTIMDDHPGVTTGVMQLNFPLLQAVDTTGDWYYFIEFAPDGFFYNTNGNNNIYLGQAIHPTESTIDFMGTGATPSLKFTGVQLRMLGGAEAFRSTDDFISTDGSSGN